MSWDRTKGRAEPIAALNRIRERENGEPLVDLREVAPSVRLTRPQVIPYCRLRVAEMAEAVARSMPSGVFFAVTDAWRPIERQVRIYDWLMRCAKEAFPGISYAALRRKVNRFCAPYDQKAPPGHCTGAAIDVMLVNEKDEAFDMTSPFSRLSGAPTYTYGLDPKVRQNRMLLLDAMLKAGFSNCRDEWWHYSYGDAGWAVRSGLQECFYGLVRLNPELYAENEKLWIKALKKRKNPWLEKPQTNLTR